MIQIIKMNNIWNELSEESKEYVLKVFNDLEPVCANDLVRMNLMDELFGKENLNPKPQIKTWEDINKNASELGLKIDWDDYSHVTIIRFYDNEKDLKIIRRVLATIKIERLIEQGYGGMITDEEWKRVTMPKYIIESRYNGDLVLEVTYGFKHFIAFHTLQQREEFLKFNENLLKDYFML